MGWAVKRYGKYAYYGIVWQLLATIKQFQNACHKKFEILFISYIFLIWCKKVTNYRINIIMTTDLLFNVYIVKCMQLPCPETGFIFLFLRQITVNPGNNKKWHTQKRWCVACGACACNVGRHQQFIDLPKKITTRALGTG